jgi:hypothetical protein
MGLAAGIAAYAISRYAGAGNLVALQAAKYWGAWGAGAGFLGGHLQHARDGASLESLKNILRPTAEYLRYA